MLACSFDPQFRIRNQQIFSLYKSDAHKYANQYIHRFHIFFFRSWDSRVERSSKFPNSNLSLKITLFDIKYHALVFYSWREIKVAFVCVFHCADGNFISICQGSTIKFIFSSRNSTCSSKLSTYLVPITLRDIMHESFWSW